MMTDRWGFVDRFKFAFLGGAERVERTLSALNGGGDKCETAHDWGPWGSHTEHPLVNKGVRIGSVLTQIRACNRCNLKEKIMEEVTPK